ncbi:uncharacterized protein LOC114058565 [Empidonax traillii]|uniref:uncharacterized protein LOC114058565 n=1 Tax=Empidonax traillii TaxID=164674 RepID=UPI000FFD9982|nr:uncharacterized protein LOC114058565 [Empidonax traillii]
MQQGTRRRLKRKEPVSCLPLLCFLPHLLSPAIPLLLSGAVAQKALAHSRSVFSDRSAAMAELTLGQMLDSAIGTPKTEPINFEQLRNLLRGMLVNLGLQDLSIQASGEPLEGAPKIPPPSSVAADIEELKQRTEANEREIAEVRALCEGLRVEIDEMKEQQSQMAENMQKMQETLDTVNFEDMLENLRDQLVDSVMSSVKDVMDRMDGCQDGQAPPDWPQGSGIRSNPWEDPGLIVIGNEITLADRFMASSPRQRDTQPSSPMPSKSRAGAQSRGKDLSPGGMSSPRVSFMESDTGWNDMGQIQDEEIKMGISKGAALPSPKAWSRGKKLPQGAVSSPRVSFMESDTGWNDMGQIQDEEIKMGISKGAALPSPKAWSRGKKLPRGAVSSPRVSFVESDVGLSDVEQSGDDEEIKTSISKAEALPSLLDAPRGMNNVEQIKDEEIKMRLSKAESLPSPLRTPPEMNDVEQIKDEEIERSFSKTKSLDGDVTALRVHPGSPGIHTPIQPMMSVRGHRISQTLWIPAESVAGTDSGSRSRTAKEAQGRGSFRMEPSQIEPGM